MRRQRLTDYSRSTGYVQGGPAIDRSNLLHVIYFGTDPQEIPDSQLVLRLIEVEDTFGPITFSFPPANNDYIWFAIPKVVQEDTLLQIGQFPVNFIKFDVTVYVDGIPIEYEVNRSEFRQHGDDIQGTIIVQ